jgi:uncharacterized repeat protein (TIGR02543 family)
LLVAFAALAVACAAPEKVAVAYVTNCDTPIATVEVEKGKTVAAPAALTKAEHTLGGWYASYDFSGAAVTFPLTVNEHTTLYAKWVYDGNTERVTVAYVTNCGTAIETDELEKGLTVAAPAALTKAEHTFGGWYASYDFSGAQVTFPLTVNEHTTLYAKWVLNGYTVTFDTHGGSGIPNEVISSGGTLAAVSATTKADAAFDGWYVSDTYAGTPVEFPLTVTADVTLHAKWSEDFYIITFAANNGDPDTDVRVLRLGYLEAAPAATNAGYVLDGWYTDEYFTDGTKVVFPFFPAATGDITFYAKWVATRYSVVFDAKGGSPEPASASYAIGSEIGLISPAKAGYSFDGWYASESYTGAAITSPYTVTGNVILYAKWTLNNYTVTYNTNGGTNIAPSEVPYEGTVAAPDVTKAGYTLIGWYLTEDFSGARITFPITVTADVTIYAKWVENAALDEDGLIFTYNSAGDYYSVTYADNTVVTEIIVPAEYEDPDTEIPAKVAIEASAFEGNSRITKVTIADGVYVLGGSAFRNCTALTEVTIGGVI